MGERHEEFIRALALLKLDGFVESRKGRGRPAHDRSSIARAFLTKAIFQLPHTHALLDRLAHDTALRRLCGWERAAQVPDETVFSRAFAELARSGFAQRVHDDLIRRTQSSRLVGHILRDATAIEAYEKPAPKAPEVETSRRRHRKSGTAQNPEQMTRIERQCFTEMTPEQMLEELPRACNVGCKPNSRGRKESWVGYSTWTWPTDKSRSVVC